MAQNHRIVAALVLSLACLICQAVIARSERWFQTAESVHLTAEQRERISAMREEMRIAKEKFESQHGKQFHDLRNKVRQSVQTGKPVSSDLQERMRQLVKERPDSEQYRQRLWTLLTPEQRATFRSRLAEFEHRGPKGTRDDDDSALITLDQVPDETVTHPPARPTTPVRRIQIGLFTANVDDAGTDDYLNIALNDWNGTWLNYGRDDFERSSAVAYDLSTENILTLNDIRYLRISKPGDDDWCVAQLWLYVNDTIIYTQNFRTEDAAGLWLNESDPPESHSHTIDELTLRDSSRWRNYFSPPALENGVFRLTRNEIESRIESWVGDAIHDDGYRFWGHFYEPRWVEAWNQDGVLHVDLDLAGDEGWDDDPDIDVDFDLSFTYVNGRISISTENVVENPEDDFNIPIPPVDLRVLNPLFQSLRIEINCPVLSSIAPSKTRPSFWAAPEVRVETNGDVIFNFGDP